jgi:hypothetical protein
MPQVGRESLLVQALTRCNEFRLDATPILEEIPILSLETRRFRKELSLHLMEQMGPKTSGAIDLKHPPSCRTRQS